MFRRPVVVRRGPSLLGAMATTAVVAGTASAVTHAKEQKYAQQEAAAQQRAAEREQLAELQSQQQAAAAPPPPTAPAPAARPDRIQQLKDLAALKEAGVLTDEEFQAEKARILAS